MKIFDENKTLKRAKMATLVILGALFLWFSFDMTGLRFGGIKIVGSAFAEEPIDFAWWIVFAACIALFVLKDKYGKYALTVFLSAWFLIQYAMYFSSEAGIANYNAFFFDTHRIIAASDTFLIKDTYHMLLDALILFALAAAVLFLVLKIKAGKKKA